jgi:putative transposase
MPRGLRCIVPGLAHHITQRGVDRRETFSCDTDRQTYLKLLAEHSIEANVRILGWCLMTNHTHLIAIPEREDSLAVLLRRVHGRYAQYACALGIGHLWRALVYVERNPVRAGMVVRAEEYRWSRRWLTAWDGTNAN